MASYFLQSIILSLCVVVFIKTILSLCTKKKKLPPSPPGLPLIGHLHLIKTPFHQSLALLEQKYGPATFLRLGTRPVLVISSKSLAEQCFTTHDLTFANRPQIPSAEHTTFNFTVFSLSNYGPYWRSVRRISAIELLSSQSLHASANVRSAEVHDMARRLFRSWWTHIQSEMGSHGLNKLDVRKSLFNLTLNVMMTLIAGKRFYGDDIDDMEKVKRFRESIEQTFEFTEISSIEDFLPVLKLLDLRGVIKKTAQLAEKNKEMTKLLIEEHRRNSGRMKETMIAHLLDMQKKDTESYKDETIQAISMVCNVEAPFNNYIYTSLED